MKKIYFFILALGFFFLVNNAMAAGTASIYPVPNTGTYGINDIINIDIVVDGNGTAFNAAKAVVIPSGNVSVQDVTLGNCGFAFVNTPSVQNLSFTGVILGDSSTKCTAYKMRLKVIGQGNASLTIINGSIKAYKKANEILGELRNASFTINAPSSKAASSQTITTTNTELPTTTTNQTEPSTYTLILTVKDDSGMPVKDALAVLKSEASATDRPVYQSESSKENGIVEFANIPKGIYSVETNYKNKKLAENVIAVNGQTPTITLGIQAKKTFSYLWLLLLLIPVVFAIILAVMIISKKRYSTTHITNISEYSPK
jgi:hypothetical protein